MNEYIISETESNRIKIMKMLLCIFVVSLHAYHVFSDGGSLFFRIYKNTVYGIAICSNSGFFLLSSILLYRKEISWLDNLKKKLKTLMVPYVFFNLLEIFMFLLFYILPFSRLFLSEEDIVVKWGVDEWLKAFGSGTFPINSPLWFLRDLFVLNLIYPLISKLMDRFEKMSLFAITLMFFFFKNNIGYLRYESLGVWCFGYYLVSHGISLDRLDHSPTLKIIYPVILILYVFNQSFEIISLGILKIFLLRLLTIIGILFWYSVFTFNTPGKIQGMLFRYYPYNFRIYLVNGMFTALLVKIVHMLIPMNEVNQVLFFHLIVIITLIMVITIFQCLEKICPKFIRFITGNR